MPNPLNILVIVDKFFPVSETFIYNHIVSLKDHNVLLIGRKRENQDRFSLPPHFETITLYDNKWIKFFHKLWNPEYRHNPFLVKELKKQVRKHKIDLVISHYGPIAIKSAHVFSSMGVKQIACFHGFDLSRKLAQKKYRKELKKISGDLDSSIIPSKFLKDRLIELGFENSKIKQIPYGVDLERVENSSKIEWEDNKIRILHAGRLIPKKGLLDLLDVIAKLELGDKIELIVIGDGAEMPQVKQKVQDLHMHTYVRLLGEQPHDVVLLYMKSVDIYVLNSRVDQSEETEGFPNTILESMASGAAVISTYHAGIPEAIDHDQNGILVEERDNEGLKRSLQELIDSPEKRKKLSENAKEKAFSEFGYNHMQSSILELINQLSIER